MSSTDRGVTPPGWPRELPPPESAEFAERVAGWLLDRAPGSWRGHPVLRRHPLALVRLVRHHVAGELASLRSSYAAARRELADVVPPDDLTAVLAAIEAEGAVVAETLREVDLVGEALGGKRWRPRL